MIDRGLCEGKAERRRKKRRGAGRGQRGGQQAVEKRAGRAVFGRELSGGVQACVRRA